MHLGASHQYESSKSAYPQFSQQQPSYGSARRAPDVPVQSLPEPVIKQKRGSRPPVTNRKRSGLHRLIMGFLRHFQSKSKVKDDEDRRSLYYFPAPPGGSDCTTRLTPAILLRIFSFVCPHTHDASYQRFEEVDIGDTCCLCDLRDLSNCAAVRRSWYQPAQQALYKSIRLDQIHFCPLEQTLQMQRGSRHGKRKSRARFQPEDEYIYDPALDPAVDRIRLLADTLRANAYLSSLVTYVKLPSQIRDNRKADIARLVSDCPNLRYIDLPHAFYEGDKSTDMIRSELWINCSNLRVMSYLPGSGSHFEWLAGQNRWRHLERLNIDGIRIDLKTFREIVARLPALKALSLSEMPDATDNLFSFASGIPDFPPLSSLELSDLPNVTADGLLRYLLNRVTRQRLRSLTLDKTGVDAKTLHEVLGGASGLQSLTFINDVDRALPLDPIPPLASLSLQTLHFEIRSTADNRIRPSPVDSYHRYLLDSILSTSLPALRALYVRDPSFPDALSNLTNLQSARNSMMSNRDSVQSFTMPSTVASHDDTDASTAPHALPHFAVPSLQISAPALQHASVFPPSPIQEEQISNGTTHTLVHQDPFADASLAYNQRRNRLSTSNKPRLQQPLEVFTKFQHDNIGDWIFRPLNPSPPPGASPRPMSTFNAEWGAHARRSILIADPDGGFLSVPENNENSSRRDSKHNVNSFRSERPRSQAWEERWAEEERDKEKERKSKMRRSRIAPGKVGDLW